MCKINPEVNILTSRKRLVLEQTSESVERFRAVANIQPPVKGWIRAVREALGMTGAQFAKRLGVTPPRVTRLEQAEVAGAATIRTMRQAAEAVDCVFVYAVVPRSTLEELVHTRAAKVASERLGRSAHTMRLEDQGLSDKEMRRALAAAVSDLVATMPRTLWDDPK